MHIHHRRDFTVEEEASCAAPVQLGIKNANGILMYSGIFNEGGVGAILRNLTCQTHIRERLCVCRNTSSQVKITAKCTSKEKSDNSHNFKSNNKNISIYIWLIN